MTVLSRGSCRPRAGVTVLGCSVASLKLAGSRLHPTSPYSLQRGYTRGPRDTIERASNSRATYTPWTSISRRAGSSESKLDARLRTYTPALTHNNLENRSVSTSPLSQNLDDLNAEFSNPRLNPSNVHLGASEHLSNSAPELASQTCTTSGPKRNQSSCETSTHHLKGNGLFRISDRVMQALKSGGPVVALETTIYTHGFPHPENIELAKSLEDIVWKNGAVPATIGIVDGVATIGLTESQIKDLCSRAGDPETMKVSRRDLPYILGMGLAGRKMFGGTTVSGTMFIASQAGIRVFGTGGLGGVHRGGQESMDISADLTELGRTSMAVISSGCKSFLDIPRTLEYLETQGATVCTFADGRIGQIDFPSFYTRNSGIKSPMVIQSAHEAAAMIYAQEIFGSKRSSGVLLANPISDEFSIPKEEIDVAINQAVKEAAEQGFHGHANTPFILARIKDLTAGRSIPVNRALIQRNVEMAAKVAVELTKFRQYGVKAGSATDTDPPTEPSNDIFSMPIRNVRQKMSEMQDSLGSLTSQLSGLDTVHPDIAVFGSVALDLSCDYTPKGRGPRDRTTSPKVNYDVVPEMHTSNIATISQSIGGVGHNVALAAHRAGSDLSVRLHSAVGDDLAGNVIMQGLKKEGLDTSSIVVKTADPKDSLENIRTAQYVSINDQKKDLVLAMADMSIFSNFTFKKKTIAEMKPSLKWVVIDGNWDSPVTRHLMKNFKSENTKVAFEPVSIAKAASIFESARALHKEKENKLTVFPDHKVDLATPNQHELAAMYRSARKHEFFQDQDWWNVIDSLGIPSYGARDRFVNLTSRKMTDQGIPLQTVQLLPFIPTILTKLGPEGVLMTQLLKPGDPRLTNPDSAPWILSRCTNGNTKVGGVYMRLFPAIEQVKDEDVVSVNGVGDTFLGVLVAGLAKGAILGENLINIAQKGAVMTLKSKEAVSPALGHLASELNELAGLTKN